MRRLGGMSTEERTIQDPYRIRPYEARDRSSVRTICFLTGSMGESIEKVYSDEESFADMFTGYFTDHEPECCFVLERKHDGVIVGYILGSVDVRRAEPPVRIAIRHAISRLLFVRPGTAGYFRRAVVDLVRDRHIERPRVDLERYPATLHMNLMPEARRGYGYAIYEVWEAYMRSRGVRGIHGEVGAANKRVRALNDRGGFVPYGEPYPALGARGPNGERQYVQMVLKSLEDDVTAPRV